MFRIKICGVTTPEDALLAAEAGADAIGLNFYEKSPRFIEPSSTQFIGQELRGISWQGLMAGVFVNATRRHIFSACTYAPLSVVQLHGDEQSHFIAKLREELDSLGKMTASNREAEGQALFQLVCALRCRSNGLEEAGTHLRTCQSQGGLPHAILLDAQASGSYGGTGRTIDWNMVRDQRDKLLGLPLILAGGLTPDNVAEAIAIATPDAVDVASGVESSPGKKDAAKVRDFVAAAKEAFARLEREKPK